MFSIKMLNPGFYLIGLAAESGSRAITVPMIVPTSISSWISKRYEDLLKAGGSSTSSTDIFTMVVSLKGPR